MNQPELLLRDIHLPEPVSWWPPAPGWWLLAIVLCSVIVLAEWWRRRALRLRNAPTALAQRELTSLQNAWVQHGDVQQLLRDLSVWLRRTSMSLTTRAQAASLTGQHWQQFLAELAGEELFSDADLQLLTAATYRPAPAASVSPAAHADGDRLLTMCQRWLEAGSRRVKRK